MATLERLPAGQPGATAGDSEPKACRHGGLHEHGTRGRYRFDECRCRPCMRANSEYQAERYRLIVTGKWAPLVDAGPVAAHVQGLVRAGMQRSEIAGLAGVSCSVVSKVLAGGAGRGGVRRVRAGTAQRLLGVSGPGVDATGTRRRLQALVATGWPPALLDLELGEKPGRAERLLQADLVSDTTADQVAWLFERMWDCPPPQRNAEEKQAADEAKARAKKNGWGPPMAWDEELNPIDDPAARPDLGEPELGAGGHRSKLPPPDELRFLIKHGESEEMIARRFGVKASTVKRALQRDAAEHATACEPATTASDTQEDAA